MCLPCRCPAGKTNPAGGHDASGGQRFKTGYMAYAGAGSNSRAQQLIVANHDDCCLAGGSPCEGPRREGNLSDALQPARRDAA